MSALRDWIEFIYPTIPLSEDAISPLSPSSNVETRANRAIKAM
jgi:hypothetical protein